MNKVNKFLETVLINIKIMSILFLLVVIFKKLSIVFNPEKLLLNYLEKFKIINQKITISLADNICTNISFSIFDNYTNFIVNNDLHSAIDVLYNLYDKGYSVMDIYDNYLLYIKPCTFVKEIHKYEIIKLLCKYITIFHNIHEDEIELALFTNNLNQLLSN